MALLNVSDVVGSVAALLDDPGQTDIDVDYVVPFINLRWANIIVNMAMLGLQYAEDVAVFDVPAGTLTLRDWLANGQPLATMMQPLSVEWKLVGAPDTDFLPAASVREVDDVPDGVLGIVQYAWKGGTVFLSRTSVDVTLRVCFNAMSTNLVDPTDSMIRGIGDIIAYRAAELIASVRGNPTLKRDMKEYGDTALDDFIAMSVLRSQSQFNEIPPTHRRGFHSGVNISLAPSRNQ